MVRRCIDGAVIALGLLAFGCNSGSALTAEQKQGKQIYESLCDRCHKLIPPKNHADEEWPRAVQKYGTALRLGPEELRVLTDYLTRANDPDFT